MGSHSRKFLKMLALAGLVGCAIHGSSPKLSPADFQIVTGSTWEGTLTYVDYSSNKPVSIRSYLTVKQSREDAASFVFQYFYPDEPKANSEQTVSITKNSAMLRDETVVSHSRADDATLKVVTTKTGQDSNRRANFRFTYLLNARTFSIVKEVNVEGATAYFERNRYSWRR